MSSRKQATVNLRYTEAIRIDWKVALMEGKELLDKSFNLPWEDKMRNVQIAFDVIHQCNNADMGGYLDLLEQYRSELKGAPITTY